MGFIIVDEHLFYIYFEIPGNFKGQIKGRDIFSLFNRENGLPVYSYSMGKAVLCQIIHCPEYLDIILHPYPIPRISGRNII